MCALHCTQVEDDDEATQKHVPRTPRRDGEDAEEAEGGAGEEEAPMSGDGSDYAPSQEAVTTDEESMSAYSSDVSEIVAPKARRQSAVVPAPGVCPSDLDDSPPPPYKQAAAAQKKKQEQEQEQKKKKKTKVVGINSSPDVCEAILPRGAPPDPPDPRAADIGPPPSAPSQSAVLLAIVQTLPTIVTALHKQNGLLEQLLTQQCRVQSPPVSSYGASSTGTSDRDCYPPPPASVLYTAPLV